MSSNSPTIGRHRATPARKPEARPASPKPQAANPGSAPRAALNQADVVEVGVPNDPVARQRFAAVERFIRDLAPRMPVKRIPEVVLDNDLRSASARYDEVAHRILIPPKMLEWDGKHARKILIHEMVHAWQNETGLLRWNLDQVGHYVKAPEDDLGKVLRNPVKILQTAAYALQPSELHAELSRMTRQLTRAAPPPPW